MAAIRKVPAIRFKGFEDEWEEKRLGEFGVVAMNKRIFKHQTKEKGEIPFYKIGTFGGEPDAFISRIVFEDYKSKYHYPTIGDILISASGSIGKTVEYLGADEYFQDSNIVWLKHNGKTALNEYLKNFYSIVKWDGLEGSTIKRLYNSNILKTVISLPRLPEQTQIGNYFKELDGLIQLQEQKLDKLTNLKKAMLEKMFPKEGADVPEIRFEGFTEKWEKKLLEEVIIDLYNGQTPSRMVESFWNGNINWLSSGELNRAVVMQTVEKITGSGKKSANLRIVPAGTFVLAITGLEAVGTRGNCAILGIDTTMNQSCMAIFPDLSKLNTFFLFQWYRRFSEEIGIKYTQGTKQQSFNAAIIKKLEITIPDIQEQKKIGTYFQSLDQLISQSQQKIEQLKHLKQALLQKMFI